MNDYMSEFWFMDHSNDIDINITDDVSDYLQLKNNILGFIKQITCNTYLKEYNVLVQSINDILLIYKESYLTTILKLYVNCSRENYEDEMEVLSFFIQLLHCTYLSELYKDKSNESLQLIYNYIDKREFFRNGKNFNYATNFSAKLLQYIENEEIELHVDFNYIQFAISLLIESNTDVANTISFLLNKENYFRKHLYKFDENKSDNKLLYLSFIKDVIEGYNYPDLLNQTLKDGIFDENDEVDILETIEKLFASTILITDMLQKSSLLISINIIIQEMVKCSFWKSSLEDIKKIRLEILKENRNIARYKQDEFNFHSFSSKLGEEDAVKLDNEISKIVCKDGEEFLKYFFKATYINTSQIIKPSIELACKFPINSLARRISINYNSGIIAEKSKALDSSFFNHYTNMALDFKKNELRNLPNIHMINEERAYTIIIESLITSSDIASQIGINILLEKFNTDVEEKVFELFFGKKPILINYQIILMKFLINIESLLLLIYNHIFKKEENRFDYSFIDQIFIYFQSKQDEFIIDSIMYINFILVEGINLRNNLVHGNYFSGSRDLLNLSRIVTVKVLVDVLYGEIVCRGDSNEN